MNRGENRGGERAGETLWRGLEGGVLERSGKRLREIGQMFESVGFSVICSSPNLFPPLVNSSVHRVCIGLVEESIIRIVNFMAVGREPM